MSRRTTRSKTRNPRRATRRAEPQPAVALDLRTLAVVLAIGAVATGLGIAQVRARFDARDYSIEARRIQDLATVRRDEVRKLEAKIGGLKAGQNLREAATGPLGMIEPAPEFVSVLEVSEDVRDMFADASAQARSDLDERLAEYTRTGKEVLTTDSPEGDVADPDRTRL